MKTKLKSHGDEVAEQKNNNKTLKNNNTLTIYNNKNTINSIKLFF